MEERLFRAIGEADGELVARSDKEERVRRKRWRNLAIAAACLALVLYAGARYLPGELAEPDGTGPLQATESDDPTTPKEPGALPLLTVALNDGGMGFEGFSAYDISELDNGNPWTEDAELETLPVFINKAYSDASGLPLSDIGEKRMVELAEEAAAALGLEITDIEYKRVGDNYASPKADPQAVYAVDATTANGRIHVYGNCTVTVFLEDEGLPLPEEYNFAHETSAEEAAEAMEYLLAEYGDILGLEEPRAALFGDYSFSGERDWWYNGYDAAGDLTAQMLSYNFGGVQFAPDSDNGNLWLIRTFDTLTCAEKIGDYPIITPEEARRLLVEGYYLTSVPCLLPGEEAVESIELMYRSGNLNEVFMPYYRFLVKVPYEAVNNAAMQESGLNCYGAYYVPAVQGEYLTNLKVWDGSFN